MFFFPLSSFQFAKHWLNINCMLHNLLLIISISAAFIYHIFIKYKCPSLFSHLFLSPPLFLIFSLAFSLSQSLFLIFSIYIFYTHSLSFHFLSLSISRLIFIPPSFSLCLSFSLSLSLSISHSLNIILHGISKAYVTYLTSLRHIGGRL